MVHRVVVGGSFTNRQGRGARHKCQEEASFKGLQSDRAPGARRQGQTLYAGVPQPLSLGRVQSSTNTKIVASVIGARQRQSKAPIVAATVRLRSCSALGSHLAGAVDALLRSGHAGRLGGRQQDIRLNPLGFCASGSTKARRPGKPKSARPTPRHRKPTESDAHCVYR